jgi:hypothetical protein
MPPQVQVHWDESSSAATSVIVTLAEPGVQGASTGKQGWGVSTPNAAVVAEATCGLDNDMHRPNGGTFAAATSVTTPAGVVADVWVPEAANVAGVVPNEHCSVAPVQTMAMASSGCRHQSRQPFSQEPSSRERRQITRPKTHAENSRLMT